MTEHDEQVAFFEYVRLKANTDPRYNNIFAVPNQGLRSPGARHYFYKEGLSPGVPDVAVMVPAGKFHGLFIEMKYGRGKVTKNQREWLNKLTKQGYCCAVCTSSEKAIEILEAYLNRKLES